MMATQCSAPDMVRLDEKKEDLETSSMSFVLTTSDHIPKNGASMMFKATIPPGVNSDWPMSHSRKATFLYLYIVRDNDAKTAR